jgi:hypothetical protein
VGRLYEALHPGEGIEHVRVEPWSEKGVELSVDFHGHRMKPPHGVLSESHLNSLAIALFLGMARTFNRTLGFLVLDDVINSFDAHHRARLADVLVAEFADLQLIVLTHDSSFFERLGSAGGKLSSSRPGRSTMDRVPQATSRLTFLLARPVP